MLYLVTGANGTGKTLFTLLWVREMQLQWKKKHKIDRPVFYDGFDINPKIEEKFGWQPCDPTKWMELPDNSIVMVDECQRIFPTRSIGSKNPDFEEELAISHRKRGFDFFLVSQHPSNISAFVRKLIGSGWHRHIKRLFGMSRVNIVEYNYAETSCEKPAGKQGAYRQFRKRFPKQVYSWYKSAELHTAKVNVPPAVYLTFGALVVAVMAVWYFYDFMMNRGKDRQPDEAAHQAVMMAANGSGRSMPSGNKETPQDYYKQYQPRIQGLPHTAPRYDEVTKPVTAPYPAACIYSAGQDLCKCYSQQATAMDVPRITCMSIVDRGYFLDWEPDQRKREGESESGVSGVKPTDQGRVAINVPRQ